MQLDLQPVEPQSLSALTKQLECVQSELAKQLDVQALLMKQLSEVQGVLTNQMSVQAALTKQLEDVQFGLSKHIDNQTPTSTHLPYLKSKEMQGA